MQSVKMRYSLRNKDKIRAKLGDDLLNSLILSLSLLFKGNVTILTGESNRKVIESFDRNSKHTFVVVSQKYDVLNLAYYGSSSVINGCK